MAIPVNFDEVQDEMTVNFNQDTLQAWAEEHLDPTTALHSLSVWCMSHGIMLYFRQGNRTGTAPLIQLRKGKLRISVRNTVLVAGIAEAVITAIHKDFLVEKPAPEPKVRKPKKARELDADGNPVKKARKPRKKKVAITDDVEEVEMDDLDDLEMEADIDADIDADFGDE